MYALTSFKYAVNDSIVLKVLVGSPTAVSHMMEKYTNVQSLVLLIDTTSCLKNSAKVSCVLNNIGVSKTVSLFKAFNLISALAFIINPTILPVMVLMLTCGVSPLNSGLSIPAEFSVECSRALIDCVYSKYGPIYATECRNGGQTSSIPECTETVPKDKASVKGETNSSKRDC